MHVYTCILPLHMSMHHLVNATYMQLEIGSAHTMIVTDTGDSVMTAGISSWDEAPLYDAVHMPNCR